MLQWSPGATRTVWTDPRVWGRAGLSPHPLLAPRVEGTPMQHHPRDDTAEQSGRRLWHRRACVRRAVTLRVDYATADGRGWLGVVRNLSLQGMYIDSALRHVAHEVAPGNLLTVAFVVPSGRPCKLRAIVIHGGPRGCGVEFLQGSPQALAHLAHYGLSWTKRTTGEWDGGHAR